MKRFGLLTLFAVMLAVPVCGPDSHAQAHSAAAEVDAIKALMLETTDAFNSHDAKAWARFCTPDAQLVTVRGESMKGVAEIETGLAAIFDGRGRAARLKMSGVIALDGRSLPPHRELSIRVLVKEQGAWRITAFHNTIVQQE